MSEPEAFQQSPDGPAPIPALTPEQRREIEGQQAAMFTPDGQLRRVAEIREAMKAARSQDPDAGR